MKPPKLRLNKKQKALLLLDSKLARHQIELFLRTYPLMKKFLTAQKKKLPNQKKRNHAHTQEATMAKKKGPKKGGKAMPKGKSC